MASEGADPQSSTRTQDEAPTDLVRQAWALRRSEPQRARELAQEAVASAPDNPRALATLALIERRLGSDEDALDHARRAVEGVAGREDPESWALAHFALGSVHLHVAAYPEARAHFERGLAPGPGTAGDEMLALLHRGLATAHFRLGNAQSSEAAIQASLRHAQAVGERALLGRAWQTYATTLDAWGRPEEARDATEHALECARESGDLELEARALRLRGIAAGRSRAHGEALENLEAALHIERQIGLRRGLANTLNVLAMQHLAMGMLTEARAFLEEALPIREAEGDLAGLGRTQYYLGYLLAKLGENEAAHDAAEAAVRSTRASGDRSDLPFILHGAGEKRAEVGDREGALRAFEEELALGEATQRDEAVVLALTEIARIRAEDGDTAEAARLVDRALEAASRVENDETSANVHGVAADVYELMGDHARALEHVRSQMKIELDGARDVLRARATAEEARAASEQQLAKAFRSTPDAILITKVSDGRIYDVNRGFETVFGWSRSEALGRTTLELGVWEDTATRDAFMDRLRNEGRVHGFRAEGRSKSGELLHAELAAESLELDGEMCVLTVVHDITESVRASEALQAALEEVKRLRDRLQEENIYLREEIRSAYDAQEIVGSSAPMLELKSTIASVARTDTTVLINGETGTGKELVVRALHEASARRDRPLIKVNCAAVAAGLVESELFGHERGAFTGALERRKGRFELSDGGSLFLDEVGELSEEVQAKLLRVLEEGEFERVGSSRTLTTDVRVFAATNRDLAREVEAGRFRRDLYYRLNVFPIHVPPLRDRGGDAEQLALHFLHHFAQRHGRTLDGFDAEAREWMRGYAWRGNVRELRNLVERAVIAADGPLLGLPDFGVSDRPAAAEVAEDATLDEVQRRHILRVLEQTGWVIDGPRGAARTLDLPAGTLRSRMQRLGIETRRRRGPNGD